MSGDNERSLWIILAGLMIIAAGYLLCGCSTPRPTPQEPAFVVSDSADASGLLDVGATPDICTLECESFARAQCVREARSHCVDDCREALNHGLLSVSHLQCVIAANGVRAVIQQQCGKRMCQ